MTAQKKSTRTRLIEAALELFAAQGVTETTTKAVAERAQVNEVTLFRHFGSKYGLLLAVMEEYANFAQLGKALVEQAISKKSIAEALKAYAQESLQALERVPELVRSVVGDAGQYPLENRLAIGEGLSQANRRVAECLAVAIADRGWQSRFPAEKLASLLNGLLLGYFIIDLTSEGDALWEGKEDFLESLVELFLHGAIAPQTPTTAKVTPVADLPSNLVHAILQRARKLGRQEYALAYVLFGGGLTAAEIVRLERSHSLSDSHQHILQINCGAVRQVPLAHWIMGKRYGSSTNNPLTQWLKSRKDDRAALFLNQEGQPMSEQELQALWQNLTQGLLTLEGKSPTIEQARQTWCVEMLMKGIELEDLSILSGMDIEELQPFDRRAREKAAIEQAHRLDRKSG
ncbi:MAG: TetR family transcriptional regulator [Hydrococcus sp. C42_A2020_068]|uniref:TetR family transcriptional regulator n=1 Tax=Pleurocapsa sp. PCC 7327 TaxID=118163 RepID=UPI00029FDEBE|nr:TetR family transcriptional regulator [Pleurocapsa sp. PCC 7327]AFY76824.1 transcriptional regulator [Pleurocapsa sp. PCC 7327]MBF2019781.1 TetR family transcriptional regulator [Hydrococcus sp. C42_A2020_068]